MAGSYQKKDAFHRKAQGANLRARSAFKIEEIQRRLKLVHSGDVVVDLGAAPGGFLQILAGIVGPRGLIVGADVEAIKPLPPPVVSLLLDVHAEDALARLRSALAGRVVDVVASDLAPKTSGIRDADEARSLALVRRALQLAVELLKPSGHFVAKVFMGGELDELLADFKPLFDEVRLVRPEATRVHSREVYIVGWRRRRPAPTNETPRKSGV